MTNKKTLVKWVLHGTELPLHQNLIYWLSPTAALEQSLRVIWDAAFWAAVLILSQIKLNSQLSNCTSFFSWHPAYLTYMQNTSCEILGWMKHKLESRLPGEISITSDMQRRRQWHPTPVLLPGKSHGRRSLVGYGPWVRLESDMTERLHFHFSLSGSGEGNGTPLQCSCLENPRDWEAWWAAVYGVTQSWTWLKRLSSSSSR